MKLFTLGASTIFGGLISFVVNMQVESVVLSIISMLSSPNDESPANIDAAKEWRENRDAFKRRVARCVRKSQEAFD